MAQIDVIATRLRIIREKAGLTQAQMAELLDVSRGSIGYYEKGERVPDILFIDRLIEKLDVSYDYLMGYSDNLRTENVDIGLSIGLSDLSIDKLKKDEDNIALNKIIEHENFENFIAILEQQSEIITNYPLRDFPFGHDWLTSRYGAFLLTQIMMEIVSDVCVEMSKKKNADWWTKMSKKEQADYIASQNKAIQETERMFEQYSADQARLRANIDNRHEEYKKSLDYVVRQRLHRADNYTCVQLKKEGDANAET